MPVPALSCHTSPYVDTRVYSCLVNRIEKEIKIKTDTSREGSFMIFIAWFLYD